MSRAIQNNPVGAGYTELGDADTLNVGTIQLLTGTTANAILDEDDMASDSATAVVTQQSAKAYVDARITKAQATGVGIGTVAVDTFADTAADACVWHYCVKNGVNLRAGTITAVWESGTNAVQYIETSTLSIGSTAPIAFTVAIVIATDMVELRATASTAGWTVLVDRLPLYQV